MSYLKFLFLLVISFFICTNSLAGEVKRTILAVVDRDETSLEANNLISQRAEMPLNHLGYLVDYVDITKKLPTDEEMKRYAGIVSWFRDNKMKGASNYAKWLTRQLNKGYKVLIIDQFGFQLEEDLKPIPAVVMLDFKKAFRIEGDQNDPTDISILIEAVHKDPEMVEFERKFKSDLPYFAKIKTLDKNSRVLLKLKRKDTGETADAIFISSTGGFILPEYASYFNQENYQTRWRINPFKFFSAVFGNDLPKPDITTINGSRIFFAQIDGDGFENVSKINNKSYSGEMVYQDILSRYLLPTSVSVIVGSILSSDKDTAKRLTEIAKKIFSLPNVETASHGMAHPLIWNQDKRKMGYKLKGYEYSPENEIGASIKYINENLAPKGKGTNVFFWTGDCRPDYEALKYVSDRGILALNGGDTRIDDQFPSYVYVSPAFRHVKELKQNLTLGANEVGYTSLWEGQFYALKYAVETFKRTESPMRIRGIDIYYHFFTGEHRAALDATMYLYDWAKDRETSPIYASDYVRIVNGMSTTEIETLGANGWRIKNNNALRTIRFDDKKVNVDLNRSKGVLGFNHYQGSLYVHLDNGRTSDIFLTNALPKTPYLVKAEGEIKDWAVNKLEVLFKLRTAGKVHFVLGGLDPNSAFEITTENGTILARSNAKGELEFNQPLTGSKFDWLNIAIKEQLK